MQYSRPSLWKALVSGALILLPVYLTILLLLKAMEAVAGLVRPLAQLMPTWVPAERLISLLAVLGVCVLVGAVAHTRAGRALGERLDKSFFERLPGYALFRSLTQQVAGKTDGGHVWQPALVELEDALVPAFVIEEFDDGRYTVFVPSVPTPLAGAVYVLPHERVHLVEVPFKQAVKAMSQWGSGAKDLVAAMERDSRAGSTRADRTSNAGA